MASFWMKDLRGPGGYDSSYKSITPTMQLFINNLQNNNITVIPEDFIKKYSGNGKINDTKLMSVIIGIGLPIRCSFYIYENGDEWMYYNIDDM